MYAKQVQQFKTLPPHISDSGQGQGKEGEIMWVKILALGKNPGTELQWESLSTCSVSRDVSAEGNSDQEGLVISSTLTAALWTHLL